MDRRDFFTRFGLGGYSLIVLADPASGQAPAPKPDFGPVAPGNAPFSPAERHMRLVDLETDQRIEVVPEYAKTTYRAKVDAHIEELRTRTQGAGMDYQLLTTNQPLDSALREYLTLRKAGN